MLNSQLTTYDLRLKIPIAFFVGCLLLVVGQTALAYSAEVVVDTGKESINAIEGVVRFPDSVNISRVETGNSAILMWVEGPVYDKAENTIRFSGISPGGFQGKQVLFSVSGDFRAGDLAGTAYLEVRAFLNDGEGTPASVPLSTHSAELPADDAPPEPFKPVIGRSDDLFGGNRFVTFLTQDKGLGIDRYEYASSWLFSPGKDDWRPAVSPVEISGKEMFKKIYIRAIDQADNYRVSTVSGPYYYATILFGIIIIVCLVIFLRR